MNPTTNATENNLQNSNSVESLPVYQETQFGNTESSPTDQAKLRLAELKRVVSKVVEASLPEPLETLPERQETSINFIQQNQAETTFQRESTSQIKTPIQLGNIPNNVKDRIKLKESPELINNSLKQSVEATTKMFRSMLTAKGHSVQGAGDLQKTLNEVLAKKKDI